MAYEDRPAVLALEAASSPHPVDADGLSMLLSRGNVYAMVAGAGDRVLGYMIFHQRAISIDVLAFLVRPESRMRGIGRRLVADLTERLTPTRRRIVFLVRETSLDMQLFLKALDFEATIIHRQHHKDTGEDAYTMERWLTPNPKG